MEQAEGELKKGISKHKRRAQEKQKENRRQARTTKKGKEILYTASPGGEKNRYVNEEFEKSRNNKISINFENETKYFTDGVLILTQFTTLEAQTQKAKSMGLNL